MQQSRAGTGESPAYSLGLGELPLAGHIEAVLFSRRPDIRAPTLTVAGSRLWRDGLSVKQISQICVGWSHKPVRQDFLDELVWTHVVELLNNPKLIEAEVQRRVEAARQTAPDERRREGIRTDLARLRRASERLLDAYQDGLLPLDALRSRLAPVRKREQALERELKALDAAGLGEERFLKLAESVGRFLSRLQDSAQRLDVEERQKVLRLVVKEILVGEDTIHIKHSIPITSSPPPNPDPGAGHVRPLERSCPLRSSRREA